MSKTVADQIAEILAEAGVERIYGVVGDSLNGITDSLRRQSRIKWIHTRHEEVAAFAAGADAAMTGRLGVCAGSCGPGNMHLINGLYDCQRNRTPVVAIAAHIPSSEIGSQYFQETKPESLFRDCSHYCETITSPDQMPRALEQAIRAALGQQGVAVLVISGDTALKAATNLNVSARHGLLQTLPMVRPAEADVDRLAALLNKARRVTLFCGAGCAGAHDKLMELGAKLQSPMVHALRGKEHVEWNNPYDVGMTGLIGFSSGYHAMKDCDMLLMLGTDFPYRQFYPEKGVTVAQVDIRPENLGRRVPLALGVIGDVTATLENLIPKLETKTDRSHLDAAQKHYQDARKGLDDLAQIGNDSFIHPQQVAHAISAEASEDAIFTCDVGLPTVWAARYIQMNGKRRLLGSFLHGSMANAMPQAIGAQCAFPKRQVISMSGDGGFAMLMGDFLSLAQLKIPVKVVVFNNGALGFVELEQKATGFLDTGTDLQNPNFAKMAEAIGIKGIRLERPVDVTSGIKEGFAHPGPVLIDAVVNRSELAMPPAIKLDMVKGFSMYMLKAVIDGRMHDLEELAATNILR